MLKKELLEAINVLILYSDFCDINIDDDRFDVKFSYYGKRDIIDSAAEIDNKSKSHLIDSVDHINFPQPIHKEEEKPIIAKTRDEYWPPNKRPDLDLEGFKIVLANYIKENPDKNQKEIGKALGISNVTVCTYIKQFHIPYISKMGCKKSDISSRYKISTQPIPIITENTHKEDKEDCKEELHDNSNGDMPNHLKKELHEMVRNAVLNINMAQTEALELKSKFDNFGENGNLITSSLGIWVLKPLNGSDSHLEFAGLATSAQYQLFPRWEIGRNYCILQFYGNTKTVEYIVNEHNGQMRISRRP